MDHVTCTLTLRGQSLSLLLDKHAWCSVLHAHVAGGFMHAGSHLLCPALELSIIILYSYYHTRESIVNPALGGGKAGWHVVFFIIFPYNHAHIHTLVHTCIDGCLILSLGELTNSCNWETIIAKVCSLYLYVTSCWLPSEQPFSYWLNGKVTIFILPCSVTHRQAISLCRFNM